MGVYTGVKALPSGAALVIDFANSKCYPGTGSTIYDLSGNGLNATIAGSLSYSSANKGILVFPGTTGNYVTSFGPNLSTTNHTVIVGSRYQPGATQGGRILSSGLNNWLLGHHGTSQNNCGDYYSEGWVYNPSSGGGGDQWHIYTALGNYSSDSWTVYRDNVQLASNNAGSQGPNKFELGRWRSNSEYSLAHVSFLLAWDRLLTASEMTQVFNSYRDRFGL